MASLYDLKARGHDPRLLLTHQQGQFQFQKVETSKFLGPIPKDNDDLLELVVALPGTEDNKVRIDQRDPTTRTKLAEIKVAYRVWIQSNEDFVTIFGERKENLKAALAELVSFIDSTNKDVQGRMISLTEHSIAASGMPVEIKSITSNGAPYRPVTKKPPADEVEKLAKNEESLISDEEVVEPQALVNKLDSAIREAADRIRPVEGELRVRVHMGVFSLQMRRANQDTFYDDDELKRFLKKTSDRGSSYVNHQLGDDKFAQRLLNVIYQTEDPTDLDACKFVGASATILSIRDIKPKYCLVLFAKDLRFEVDIKYEPGYYQHAAAERIRGFSCARRDRVVEIAVSCPNRAFDWHLAIEAETSASRIPPEITNFVKHGITFKSPASDEDFLVTKMDEILRRAANIDNIACNVSWTFEFAQKPYRLEISIYHEWGPEAIQSPSQQWRTFDTAGVPPPIKSCGIMMYNQEWDDKMQQINNPGGRKSDFANGFPELFVEGDLAFGVENFLQEMKVLHEFTELATVPDQN
ncbi:hypothetical protein VP1G_10270 [Cytospora mali]|uniref:DUF7905 domain-containing protein n=1 Tax=Cytospora mali TaxID=578113 RepID=A0A194VGL0_CYTMA|nr:hypothetical protein VP1G_10270 [Valsa mali var. pyri (nom. inval.)]